MFSYPYLIAYVLDAQKGNKTTRRQNNPSTHFFRQLVDRLWDNSSTLCETTRQHLYSKLIDQLMIIAIIFNEIRSKFKTGYYKNDNFS